MTDTNKEVLDFTGEGKPKLAGGLNILTILTIIGSILGFVSAVYSFMTAKKVMRICKRPWITRIWPMRPAG